MKRKEKTTERTRDSMLHELDILRQQLNNKETQLTGLRQQMDQGLGKLGNMSGWSAADIKARLLEEAERARAEAERAQAEAEKHAEELEQARQGLKKANLALARRNMQMEAAAEVAREAAGILDVRKLLETTVHLISERFGFYQAAVFVVDEAGKYAVLRAASWDEGKRGLARGHRLQIDQGGLVGQVARTGEPGVQVSTAPSPTVPGELIPPDQLAPRSEVALPLKVRDRVIGVLDVGSMDPAAFTGEEVAILQTLADQVAVALENARLFEQIKRHSRQLLTAAEVSKSAMTILDPEELTQDTVKLIREGFDLHYVGLFLVKDAGSYAVLCAASGGADDEAGFPIGLRTALKSGCGIARSITTAKATINLAPRTAGEGRPGSTVCTLPETRSEMVLPLIIWGKAIGALVVQSIREAAFSEKERLVFQTMVDQLAIALDNARLFKETREAKLMARQTQEAAEAANRAKSIFLANMSHELRTPLNAILGFTQLMERDALLTSTQRENLEIISRSGSHLLSLINDVLEMSKIEAGRTVLTEQHFDLHRMLDELVTMFQLRAADKALDLDFECGPEVPQYVRADEGKLRQILINLLGNAVKFTGQGRVMLRAHSRREAPERGGDTPPGYRLHFEIEDTGPGIPQQDQETIFEPFVQAENRREYTEGTGLGLPISRQFARLMGGDIMVRSTPGEGSCFTCEVSVEPAEAAEVTPELPDLEVIGIEPGATAPDGGPYRLLVVEDREGNRRLLVELLSSLGPPPDGFEVRAATNGKEALEIWRAWQPHLIWMDMRMPVMDGYEATHRIKGSPEGAGTVVIALTASAFEEDRQRIFEVGCDDFVRKPFRSAEIFEKMAEHLGVRYCYGEPGELHAASDGADGANSFEPTPATVAALPEALLVRLEQAAVETDFTQITEVIEAVRDHNAALAERLAHWADNFEYHRIGVLVQEARRGFQEPESLEEA